MKLKSSLVNIVRSTIVGGLALTLLNACGDSNRNSNQGQGPLIVTQYVKLTPQVLTNTVDGVIKEVEPSSIPAWFGQSYSTSVPITFIQVNGDDGNKYSLIYPFAIGAHKEKAKISFLPAENRAIKIKDILKNSPLRAGNWRFEGGEGTEAHEYSVVGDGIIIENGIDYGGNFK